MRIMVQNKELKEFIDRMIRIYKEKRPKYAIVPIIKWTVNLVYLWKKVKI